VSDQHGVAVAAERLVERVRVEREHPVWYRPSAATALGA
jgi:hypothetical protein